MYKAEPLNRVASITLGKMLQPAPRDAGDVFAPYLRAAHVQPFGRVIDLPDQRMWFSSAELKTLDLRRGDVVVVEGGAGFGRSAFIGDSLAGWAFQNSILRVRPVKGRADGRFLNYAVQHAQSSGLIGVLCNTATFAHFTAEKAATLRIPTPAYRHQLAVADFLDRETGEIDTFIRDQEELIGLLQERRAATISHAVTRGLNPDVPFTESGSDWLGLIPSHWTVATLRRILGVIEQGVSPQAEAGPAKEGETGVLKSGCVNGGIFREDEQKKLPDGFSYPASLVVRPGDLLMNRASGSIRLLGSAALVDRLSSKLILSDKTFRLRPLPSMASTQYLNALLNSTPTRRQIESSVSGAEGLANNLPMASIRRLVVAVPPLEEQSRIANYLQGVLQEVDLTIADARRAVALSRERRAALISGAVTGNIDVRGHVGV